MTTHPPRMRSLAAPLLRPWKFTEAAPWWRRAMTLFRPTALLALLALALPLGAAEEDDLPPPPPKKEGVQIMFLPPPMEGALSLGIYNQAGKLVRTLHHEATTKDFTKGLNGLITQWDGRDDAGQPAPAGTYLVRGWTVGDLKVEGVAFHANDWIDSDDSPRFTRVLAVQNSGHDEVDVVLRALDGSEHTVGWKLAKPGVTLAESGVQAALDDGKLVIRKGAEVVPVPNEEGEKAIAVSVGFAGHVWAIFETPAGREIRAYTETGEFLRRLAYAKDEPAPKQLAASQWSESIFLFEENTTEQRVRALALGPPKADGSPAWKTIYQKRLVFNDTYAAAAPTLGRTPPVPPVEEMTIRTKPNPLLQNAKTDLKFHLVADAKGSLLVAADGLPLAHLTDTPGLKWAALVQEKDAVLFFESDGAAVAEFKITHPANIMAFEAGDYELKR